MCLSHYSSLVLMMLLLGIVAKGSARHGHALGDVFKGPSWPWSLSSKVLRFVA